MLYPAELDEIKSRSGNDCAEVARKWASMRHKGRRIVGPCPLCSRNPQS